MCTILQSWILPLYSIVTYAAALKTVDFVVEGFDRAKSATIITDKPDEICKALSDTFKKGMTRIAAKGGFSGENKTMVYFVINRFQITRMKNIVHEIAGGIVLLHHRRPNLSLTSAKYLKAFQKI